MTPSKWLRIGALSVIIISGILTHTATSVHAEERSLRWEHVIGIQHRA